MIILIRFCSSVCAAILILATTLATPADANLVYALEGQVDAASFTATGTITTDGTLGALDASNIVSSMIMLSSPGPESVPVPNLVSFTGVTATATELIYTSSDDTEVRFRDDEAFFGSSWRLSPSGDDALTVNRLIVFEGLSAFPPTNVTSPHTFAIVPEPFSADFSGDSMVDSSDFTILTENWQMSGDGTTGDATGDGFVDSGDFSNLTQEFGMSADSPAGDAANLNVIPEPSSIVLVGLGVLGLMAYRRRHKASAKHRRAFFRSGT